MASLLLCPACPRRRQGSPRFVRLRMESMGECSIAAGLAPLARRSQAAAAPLTQSPGSLAIRTHRYKAASIGSCPQEPRSRPTGYPVRRATSTTARRAALEPLLDRGGSPIWPVTRRARPARSSVRLGAQGTLSLSQTDCLCRRAGRGLPSLPLAFAAIAEAPCVLARAQHAGHGAPLSFLPEGGRWV